MTVLVLRGDARVLPLADASVDLIVTSPPYFALRSYTDGGEHYAGQIGSEATPADYIAALIDCTREWVRVLKPSGSMFVNLGDKYSGSSIDPRERPPGTGLNNPRNSSMRAGSVIRAPKTTIRPKSLLLLPERYRIACVDELGLIARAVIVWAKPNGLPESVTDRVRRSHEDWVHLTKAPRYFAAVDEIREAHADPRAGKAMTWDQRKARGDVMRQGEQSGTFGAGIAASPLGKLPSSVWEIPTQPLTVPKELGVDHFAAFPMDWPRRLILGWSPSGICVECGEGRRPVAARDPIDPRYLASNKRGDGRGNVEIRGVSQSSILRTGLQAGQSPATRITGHACKCPEPTAPTRAAVILDPFGGTGTTALVASVLGRVGISVDLSADYCRLARWRTTDPGERARAMQVDKPEPVHEAQMSLLDELGVA